MTSRFVHSLAATAAVFLLTASAVRPAAAEQTGELWETTSQMSMEGMPIEMPAQKRTVGAPKEWTAPPGGADERQKCTTSGFKIDGAKATWKVACAGPPASTGVGEITRSGADAYTGVITFTSDGGNMRIKLGGKRLGACDAPK